MNPKTTTIRTMSAIEADARRNAQSGNVILAIKLLRDGHQIPLKDAKDTVEGWLRQWGKLT